ncbi:hypothetical protein [Methanonatronarchaeum sp. AMET6-2]|nr:hypothetical protein [Methanonatronarchaeum sp. AMET6-2]
MKCKECNVELKIDLEERTTRCPKCGGKKEIEGKDDRCLYKVW